MANAQNPNRTAQRTLPAPIGTRPVDRANSSILDPDRDLLSTIGELPQVERSATASERRPAPARTKPTRGVSRLLPFWAGSRRFQVG